MLFFFIFSVMFISQYAYSSPTVVALDHISDNDITVTEVKALPLLTMQYYCAGTEETRFMMFPNGFSIWHNDSSPTGYYAARLPEDLKRRILALAQSVEWGKDYKVVEGHDLPLYKFRFVKEVTTIRGNPNSNYGIDTNVPFAFVNKLMNQVPENLRRLHTELDSFNYANRTVWLPSEVHIKIYTDTSDPRVHSWRQLPSKFLPLHKDEIFDRTAEKSDDQLHSILEKEVGATEDFSGIRIDRTVRTATFKREILELIALKKQGKEGLLVNGTPCFLNIEFPAKAFETIPMR
jgi:hypothetical protein